MIKIAIVGLGIIADSHIKATKELAGVELVAVCDIDPEKVKRYSDSANVWGTTDYKELAALDIDAVILNLPHWLHCAASVFFLEAGKHVLVEKPMAMSVSECDEMIAASEKSGKKLAVGHIQRYFSSIKAAEHFYRSGELGKLCLYTENRTVNYFDEKRPRWFLQKEKAGGGIVMNYGAHAFDKLFYVMDDAKLVKLDSFCGNYLNSEDIEGHAQIFAGFDNGVSASITFSGYTSSGYDAYWYFTKGALRVRGTRCEVDRGTGFEKFEVPFELSPFAEQLNEFCKYIGGKPANIPTAEYGRKVIAQIERVLK
ncbi:MAG: Gfo/Idh/MocA family oxidoreductase [Clostridia bacterium]|nr:Gfo/Idh/MocA family oxidoreductase [Clostridia bacterium]